jgi:sugar/nucleoside kinase (ribokinase family)
MTDLPSPSDSPPIAVVGNVNLDLRTSPLHASERLFADGETSVAEIYETPGGGAANLAVAAARLGGEVHLCACVGDDELGQRLERALATLGVIPHLRRKPVATGRSINLVWDQGQRHFVSSLPNTHVLQAEDVDWPALAGCRHLFRADIWFAELMLEAGNAELLQQARQRGWATSLDINWDPLWSDPSQRDRVAWRKQQVWKLLPSVDYVHGNEQELIIFAEARDAPAACRTVVDAGAGCVICHCGAKGSAWCNAADGWVEVPATPVSRVVCATGCGDVFSAAFLLAPEQPLAGRLRHCGRIAAGHLAGELDLLPRLSG